MPWLEFTAAMILFLAAHRIPAMLGVKHALSAALGPRGYTVLFSAVSLLLLWWVIVAAAQAPYVQLWDHGAAARWGVNLLMPLVAVLVALGVGAPNPFAFEGRATGFDPDRPGVAGLTRQPLLWALLLWSLAHLWANGALAHVILFGSFAGFSLLGMRLVERRRAAMMSRAEWARLTARTALVPLAAAPRWRGGPYARLPWARVAIGLAAWAIGWHLHTAVIGVPPLP
ncbi:NnrU family protein [Pseudoponticoccus marisrubri]|uniref:NnrU family protein n=1 Tax=Pseudoponticoccus marisrubri TaxID=1685382 RepID=A0A0W7WK38_9RHOB|nr:NnrU family protein [Pseudoponticoccus marisrubri]KUF10939.1 NnrU family protein [Pseudoponticoccus marisrubri]